LPTKDGTSATAQAGCLIILNSNGHPIATVSGNGINGPWDMTALDMGATATLYVTNVLNGTVAANGAVVSQGSVLRIVLSTPAGGTPGPLSFKTIASTFAERTDPAALVIGPTGLALGEDGTLFVADTLNDRIAAISNAASRIADAHAGMTLVQGGPLKMPLGLAIAPNGNILTMNAANGQIVESTPNGMRAGARFVDLSHSRNGTGTLFGVAVAPGGNAVYFVNDGNNTLAILQ
jgi:DNA-binding beta-propeller fold protein YncE